MKPLTLYHITVPVFVRYLSNLDRIIGKAKRFAKSKKGSERSLAEGRLAPDMYNFTQQIGYAYFAALEATTNLSGIAHPELGYDEKTLSELQSNLRTTIAFLKRCPEKKFAGAERKKVSTYLDPGAKYMAHEYVLYLVLPNFFFHVTTAYDILRHAGVPLGKNYYIGLRRDRGR